MIRSCSLLMLLGFASLAHAAVHRRALVIGLDGTTGNQLHYQALIQGKAPALADLMRTGKFAPCIDMNHPSTGGHLDPRCARAHSGHRTGDDFKWLTGPGWCSVLTGVENSKHSVKDNSPESLSVFSQTSLEHPTFMKRLVAQGLKTAAGGVSSFMTSNNNGTALAGIIDYECGADEKHQPLVAANATSSCNLSARQAGDETLDSRDETLTRFMESKIADPSIDLVMGVYDRIDAAGHRNGFSSNTNYLQMISDTDVLVARLIRAVEAGVRDRHEQWLVIATADHGGHHVAFFWGNHDIQDGEDDAIPFIIKTFGASQPLRDLTYPVTHMDVHPTLMDWFGLPMTPGLDGHVQALSERAD